MEAPNEAIPVVSSPRCFICNGSLTAGRTSSYRQCPACGHESLVSASHGTGHMLNDPLDEADARRETALDRFKRRVLLQFSAGRPQGCLVDIGSASGKFLIQNSREFERSIGIEITPEAVAFSRDVLKLQVVDDLAAIDDPIDLACAWHSLEHIPGDALHRLLAGLREKMLPGSRLIVSVPNNQSFQYRWFRGAYAFFDVPNHVHQFSPTSLHLLLSHHGFVPLGRTSSSVYKSFGYVQALLNVATRSHNYLYYRLKRRSAVPSPWRDAANVILFPLVLPVAALLSLLDRLFPDAEGVMTLCFERTNQAQDSSGVHP